MWQPMTRGAGLVSAAAMMMLTLSPATALGQQAQALVDQVRAAYEKLDQYQSKTDITVRMESSNGQSRTQNHALSIAFDRPGQRLRVDQPGGVMAINDGTLKMTLDTYDKHHLEKQAPSPLRYSSLSETARLPLPELAMLTEDDPLAALATGQNANTQVVDIEGSDAKGLSVSTRQGEFTMHIDPDTHMIEKTVQTMDMSSSSRMNSLEVTFDHQVEATNQTLDNAQFSLKTANSEAVDSMQALMEKATSSMRGSAGGEHALTGKDAPDFKLETMSGGTFQLSQAKADVIILDFWATWCGPCRRAMPKLQSVHDWAKENGKSAAIYAVNLRESKQKAKDFWQQNGYTMPVLMDTEGKVGNKYQASSIPQTVVIADGKVKTVHVGYSPDIDGKLKDEIKSSLSKK